MNFYVLTLFPEMVKSGLSASIIGRAIDTGLVSVETVNIRDYAENKHNRVDDYPYGGGAGMVMQPGPVYRACKDLEIRLGRRPRVIYMTPQGRVFDQKIAEELSREEELVFLCGHYEGIDERALELVVTDQLSAGDYVLTGGELPAMMMIDCISRLVPGVLNNEASAEFETFHDNLLEYPQYTRPEEFMGKTVPEVLRSGHHANIEKWRREQSLERTLKWRPDLLETAELSKQDREYLRKLKEEKQSETKSEAKSEPKSELKTETQLETKAEMQAEPKAETQPEPKAETKSEPKAETQPETKAEAKAETQSEAQSEPKLKTSPDVSWKSGSDDTVIISWKGYSSVEKVCRGQNEVKRDAFADGREMGGAAGPNR